jgi:DsbC/DsbD-like thiol-disulfide interchange protein
MYNLTRFLAVLAISVALGAPGLVLAAPNSAQPANPAKVTVSVSPENVAPGGEAQVTVKLKASSGIKINRYPKIKVSVPAKEGFVAEAEAEVGSDSPPPLDDPDSNYFGEVDPVSFKLDLDDSIQSGSHEIEGKLTYYYCVTKSGFCAPKRTSVKIAVNVQ